MKSHIPQDQINREHEKIQFVHESFYQAFRRGDWNLMQGLWVKSEGVSVIHPGRPPISGYDNVMESWRNILTEAPSIEFEEAELSLFGNFALITCIELVNRGEYVLSAVNGMVLEENTWRFYYHHSSLIMLSEEDEEEDDNSDDIKLH